MLTSMNTRVTRPSQASCLGGAPVLAAPIPHSHTPHPGSAHANTPHTGGAKRLVDEYDSHDERRQSAAKASSSGSSVKGFSSGVKGGTTNAAATPRARRKRQIPDIFLPKVVIVGRPNVGKSALFNRLAGSAVAVVYDEPGVTRDRLYHRAFWGDKEYVLIDTGGLMSDASQLPIESNMAPVLSTSLAALPGAIERQAAAGVAEADTVVLLVDGQMGLQAGDREILQWLRVHHPHKPVLLGVNKCENTMKSDLQVADFWELGVTPIAVSALSGTGTGELLDALVASLPRPISNVEEDLEFPPLAIAIVGRPNVATVTEQTQLQESEDDTDVLIEFIDVCKSFGDKVILDGASFKIRRGEAVGIIGASGTGKSTTLRLAAGLLVPDSGVIKILGKTKVGLLSDTNNNSLGKQTGEEGGEEPLRIGMVFQNAALFDSLDVGANVGFLLYEHSSLPIPAIKALVADSLQKVSSSTQLAATQGGERNGGGKGGGAWVRQE
ncbi:MAG: hypothetical protein WDW38_007539 [Sanguina aurantia]